MGKRKVIAEPAPASTVCDGHCGRPVRHAVRRFHGEEDIRRQALNVFRMKLLGATVHR